MDDLQRQPIQTLVANEQLLQKAAATPNAPFAGNIFDDAQKEIKVGRQSSFDLHLVLTSLWSV